MPWKFILSTVLLGLSLCCGENRPLSEHHETQPNIHGFTKGVAPVAFNPEHDGVYSPEKKRFLTNSSDCKSCHKRLYKNWEQSRHRVAFTNQLYKESHRREPLAWCVNCHAPLASGQKQPFERLQVEDGISCVVCHVRKGKIITTRLPDFKNKPPQHKYLLDQNFDSDKFCANCHQFNFPTLQSITRSQERLKFSSLVMQNTVQEHRSSTFDGIQTCAGCHLMGRSAESHSFPGGHDLKGLAGALKVRLQRQDSGKLAVTLYTMGIGHAFPTGDLFRTLRLHLRDRKSGEFYEILYRKSYVKNENLKDAALEPWFRLENDSTIPPPRGGEYLSSRRDIIPWPDARKADYALYIDYLFGLNHLLTKMPLSKTRPLIKKGRLRIEKGVNSIEKG